MAAERLQEELPSPAARVQPPGPLLRRILPSPLDLLVIGAFLLSLTRPVFTDSVWWRLRVGAWIVEHFDVPRSNLYAFTAVDHPWITHSWASDVLLHLTFDRLGPGWLLLLRGTVLALTTGLLYRLLRRRGGVIPSLAIATLTLLALLPELRIGPLLFGGLLLVVMLNLLEDPDWRFGRALIFLPLVFLVWANVHGSFIVGLGLLLAHCLGDLRDARRHRSGGGTLGHAVAAVLAALCYLCNPYYGAPYAVAFEDLWQLLSSVAFRLQVLPWVFLTVASLGALTAVLVIAAAGRELRWRLALPFLLLTPIGLLVPGYSALWMLWGAVTLMEHLQQLAERVRHERGSYLERVGDVSSRLRRLADRFAAWSTFDRFLVRGHYTALGFAVALACFSVPAGNTREVGGLAIRGITLEDLVPPELAPHRGAGVLIANAFPDARVMAPAYWGGYLLWAGYPALQVFIDDRESAYPLEVEDEYDRFVNAGPGWEEVLDRYQVDYVLWPSGEFQPRALQESGRWTRIHADEVCIVLARQGAGGPKVRFEPRVRLEPGMRQEPPGPGLAEEATHPAESRESTPAPKDVGFGLFRPNRSGPREP